MTQWVVSALFEAASGCQLHCDRTLGTVKFLPLGRPPNQLYCSVWASWCGWCAAESISYTNLRIKWGCTPGQYWQSSWTMERRKFVEPNPKTLLPEHLLSFKSLVQMWVNRSNIWGYQEDQIYHEFLAFCWSVVASWRDCLAPCQVYSHGWAY